MAFKFEIDFIPVGTGERSGDATAVRYSRQNPDGTWQPFKIVIVDGGTTASGEALVRHVQYVYQTNKVDLVINTHPDNDHCSGLRVVLDTLAVGQLWVHRPWNYPSEFLGTFADGKLTQSGLKDRLKDALEIAHELTEIARKKGIPVYDPFEGTEFDSGVVTILGPSQDYYKSLVCHFRDTPPAKAGLLQKAYAIVESAVEWVGETLQIETLTNDGVTSAENNSSAIVFFDFGDHHALLTSDAGIPALSNAANFAEKRGFNLKQLRFIQVPHHGSRRNVGPEILNRMMGQTAFVNVGPKCETHPRRKVVNAFVRRQAKVYVTKGKITRHHSGDMPSRNGYVPASELPFYQQVEK